MRMISRILAWVFCFALGAGCGADEDVSAAKKPANVTGAENQAPEPQPLGVEERSQKKVLDEVVLGGTAPRHREHGQFAEAILRSMYQDGRLGDVLDAFAFRTPKCRIGTYACAALETPARRAGALVALVPSKNLRPTGMDESEFTEKIAKSLKHLIPAPDKSLPYIPLSGEVLYSYKDHHGLSRYLLLREAGDTYRVLALFNARDMITK